MRVIRSLSLFALALAAVSSFAQAPPPVEVLTTEASPFGVSVAGASHQKGDLQLSLDVEGTDSLTTDPPVLRFRIYSKDGECKGTRTFVHRRGPARLMNLRLTEVEADDLVVVVADTRSTAAALKDRPEQHAGMRDILRKHKIDPNRVTDECRWICRTFNIDCQYYCGQVYNCSYCTECTVGGLVPPCDNLSCYCVGPTGECFNSCPIQ